MRFFVLPIFDGVIMDGHPTQNIGCPSIMTPSKMGKTKYLIFYSLSKESFLAFFSIRNWCFDLMFHMVHVRFGRHMYKCSYACSAPSISILYIYLTLTYLIVAIGGFLSPGRNNFIQFLQNCLMIDLCVLGKHLGLLLLNEKPCITKRLLRGKKELCCPQRLTPSRKLK